MSYGLEIYDENGELIVDNKKLMNRVYYRTIVTTEITHYYAESFDYKPPIMQSAYSDNKDTPAYPFVIEHIIDSNGNYIGFKTLDKTLGNNANSTIIIVFKIR